MWNDFPNEETSGTCRQFTCKYHAWRYSLEGDLTFVQQEDEFFDIDKSQYGLVPVRCEVWEGFIFVNFDNNAKPLTDYLGPLAKGIEGYPFHEMTEVYSYRAEVGSNWKLFIDAFVEFYHAPVLHQGQYTKEEAAKIQKYGFEALHYERGQPAQSMISTWGGQVAARGPEHGQADGPGAAQRAVRAVGQARGHREASTRCHRVSTRSGCQAVGHRLVPLLPELHAADLGAGLVPDLPLLADRASTSTSSSAACTSCRRGTRGNGWPRSWPR